MLSLLFETLMIVFFIFDKKILKVIFQALYIEKLFTSL